MEITIDKITERVVREAALRFISEQADILNINSAELGEVRITNTDSDYLWDVFITREVGGIPVRYANVSLGINHGNVSLWGVEKWGDIRLDLVPRIDKEQALVIGFNYIGGRLITDILTQEPQLEIVPIAPQWDGTIGRGYDHALVWSFIFKR
ncbi:MAG: hypothetical protein A2Y62_16090 [Candidatus Fischerbacteria bacterium RBG_13_37_8]|uniref:Uncharacterized protein n=1 Tax=Candidatus Fischerbacteria bacterium RBG_13_37_8 TaxID=1817863 RepID=A0A1F5VXR8_9BACT|nr:MAG: hypothetical protein A2Y62_16090 [Candidatus Fischerbacteria bacterium RBG_13_37_8]